MININSRSKIFIDFTQSGKRFVLSLHYDGSNSFLFVNATKVHHLKAKNSEVKDYALCLGNDSKEFRISYTIKKGLKGQLKILL